MVINKKIRYKTISCAFILKIVLFFLNHSLLTKISYKAWYSCSAQRQAISQWEFIHEWEKKVWHLPFYDHNNLKKGVSFSGSPSTNQRVERRSNKIDEKRRKGIVLIRNVKKDKEGAFTYVGGARDFIVVYVTASKEAFKRVESLEVQERVESNY